jgi:hypothetical protein
MSTEAEKEEENQGETFVEGRDFYFEDGMMVLTARFLKNRGYCFKNGCRHCPYPSVETDQSK